MVAKMMGTTESDMHRLGVLSSDECWLILSRIAFCQRSENKCQKFKEVGKKIADKCKGLPLAAKALGSLLHFKYALQQWNDVLENEIWEFKEVEIELFPHLVLSYNELSPALKRCFSFLSVLPKDEDLFVQDMTYIWLALGYLGADDNAGELELRGREYFDNLAMCSLLQDFKKDDINEHLLVQCKMHDIIHDFARSLRKGTMDGASKASCQVCSPSLISTIKEYRTLVLEDQYPTYICDCLKSLRVLRLKAINPWSGIPNGVEKLIHLRYLHFDGIDATAGNLKAIFMLYNLKVLVLIDSKLEGIPKEIGNLVRLRHLNLSRNCIKELPETICDLHELRSLDISHCYSLRRFPPGIHKLTNLKHLHMKYCPIYDIGKIVGQLIGLRTLDAQLKMEKLEYLKKLNQLGETLHLLISPLICEGDEIDDAREAKLNKKAHLQKLILDFKVDSLWVDSVWVDMLDALRPHQNLVFLNIDHYGGSKLPDWIASPLNMLTKIEFRSFMHLSQLPALGKLPCLEELTMSCMEKLKFVGRGFLGIRTTIEDVGSPSNVFGFPKLKDLVFEFCDAWEEWEDITAEEEHCTTLSLFPCLKRFKVGNCDRLKALPQRLWPKVITSSTNLYAEIYDSTGAAEDYKNILGGSNPGEGFCTNV